MRRLLVIVVLVLSVGVACAPAEHTEAVTLAIRYSSFRPDHLTVPAGTTVRFVVDNRDPIDHELIVGDRGVQRRHEHGTEPVHGAVPGEVSAPAGAAVDTTYTFERPGTVLFGCHLPGHYAYGMRGTIRVV